MLRPRQFTLCRWLLWPFACLIVLSLLKVAHAEAAKPEIDVILWFDTEDYLSPGDDDATLRLCQLLTTRDIRATFKVVGEKARVLEQRGRRDVIAALQRHDIGYHANLHSVHPTPTEYLAECGWLDGVEEFTRREGGGAADVRRIFGVGTLACYGQPGWSWGPQAIAALKPMGIAPHGVPCYVDDGTHVGLDHRPFYYANALMVYDMGPNQTRMKLHDPTALEPANQAVSQIAERLGHDGGGLISIYFHPCEWVHKVFWDAANFKRGANPPREQWKAPPQRSAEETDAAFKQFEKYIDHIRSIPGIRWITASDLPLLYPDLVHTEGASETDLTELAHRIESSKATGLDIITLGSHAYSVADQFELLTRAVVQIITTNKVTFPVHASGLLGPDAAPTPNTSTNQLNWFQLRDATRDVSEFIEMEHRVPSRVFVGADKVAPADFLVGLAEVWNFYAAHGKPPTEEAMAIGQATAILPEKHVAEDTPDLFGHWIIHKAGFQAPKLVEQARLQAWTLKPALRNITP